MENQELSTNQNTKDTSETKKKYPKKEYAKKPKREPIDYSNLPPNTIYNALVESNIEFSRKDLRKISNAVHEKFVKRYGEDKEPEKVQQKENETTYNVFVYPNEMRREIKNIVQWFFQVKDKRSEKHIRLLALEKLQKLKKLNSPEYEMLLVKFNIAEDERRKREKAEQLLLKEKAAKKLQRQQQQTTKKPFNKNNYKSPNFKPKYNKDIKDNKKPYVKRENGDKKVDGDKSTPAFVGRRYNADAQKETTTNDEEVNIFKTKPTNSETIDNE
ncbi:MAG: hypothetical protein LBO69_09290 [Ignavibacteria bacterium]|jgi:hypothetical protein|nr:hypothetical protein [Ignavibacteria bacterium]